MGKLNRKPGMKIASIISALIIIAGLRLGAVNAQTGSSDSITVEQAIGLTLQNHPAIRQAEYAIAAWTARIDVSRSALYPDISVGGEYVRIGPVPTFELPEQGPLKLAPYNNYDFRLGLRQTIYDFGRTDEAIKLAKALRQSAADNMDMVKSSLAYQMVGVFNSILILHQRIAVLDEQLQTLGQHLDMSSKKLDAGTATDFDTLTIKVKIAVVQNDRIDAVHAMETQEIIFRQMAGLPPDMPVNLRGSFAIDGVVLDTDSLMAAAGKQRPELVLSRDVEANAARQSQLVSLGNKPLLFVNLTTGFKNGYEPDLNTLRGNYAAGLELKVPVFNGQLTKYQKSEADANLNVARAHTDDLVRQIRSEVLQAIAGVNSSLEKISSIETQVRQAEKAVSMARVRYTAGVITNLDLLDAEMTLSQTKLVRVRAFYDYTVSLNALDKATGKKIW
jgi:outer membrane protein